MVTQATFLFNDTVRNNIAYGLPHRPEEEIIAAAKAAHAHDFIMALPEGYATQIGELGGAAVRRPTPTTRYCASALEKRTHVDRLDEATSSLDNESERLVQDAIGHLMVGRTVLVIAHRLSTIQKADRIVVLDNGHIMEEGPHEELPGTEHSLPTPV